MSNSPEHLKKILEFREKKSRELKRILSYGEAIALWLSESLVVKPKSSIKNFFK